MAQKHVTNATTGETTLVDLTPEEELQRAADALVSEAIHTAEETERAIQAASLGVLSSFDWVQLWTDFGITDGRITDLDNTYTKNAVQRILRDQQQAQKRLARLVYRLAKRLKTTAASDPETGGQAVR